MKEKSFVYKLLKSYDVVLTIAIYALVLFTGFVIVYYTLPEQTSALIAKAFSYTNNEEVARKFMDYLNGFTIGAGFPLLVSLKSSSARMIMGVQNKLNSLSTKSLLVENIGLQEIQLEFQKAEAYRFMNNPTIHAKARLHYKNFITKIEETEKRLSNLKPVETIRKKIKSTTIKAIVNKSKKTEIERDNSTDALI